MESLEQPEPEDDVVIMGDTDAWFEALERGDFFAVWEKEQRRIQKVLRQYGETNTWNVPSDTLEASED